MNNLIIDNARFNKYDCEKKLAKLFLALAH